VIRGLRPPFFCSHRSFVTSCLGEMIDLMPDFKAILDSGYGHEIDANAARFPGLFRYGLILTNVAEGIVSGTIQVSH
jgi:hypothetical protein